jgi:4-carboxymuconolactone decarboxylase
MRLNPIAAALCLLAGPALAQDRMPPLAPDQLTPEQSSASEAFLAARKVPVFGPFVPCCAAPS